MLFDAATAPLLAHVRGCSECGIAEPFTVDEDLSTLARIAMLTAGKDDPPPIAGITLCGAARMLARDASAEFARALDTVRCRVDPHLAALDALAAECEMSRVSFLLLVGAFEEKREGRTYAGAVAFALTHSATKKTSN